MMGNLIPRYVTNNFSNEILHHKARYHKKIHNQKHLTWKVKQKVSFLENKSIDFMALVLSQWKED
jgi:hypothetical protein